jgi:hypothetical protein
VEGYLSKLIGQGWSPENMPEKGEWFWKDVQRMADWCGGEERRVQPVLVDVIDRKSERPIGRFPLPIRPIGRSLCSPHDRQVISRMAAGRFGYSLPAESSPGSDIEPLI